jgi:hypothetical protein
MRALGAMLLVLALAGFGSCQRRDQAPVGDADPQCYLQCTSSLTDTGVRWQADAESAAAWDALGEHVVPELSDRVQQCERRRQACTDFLNVLKQRGVIRAGE